MRWPPVSRLDPFCSYMPLFFHPSIHDHLSLPVVVRHRPHGRLEVGRGLLLDLVGERVDLEAVEARHEREEIDDHGWKDGRTEACRNKTDRDERREATSFDGIAQAYPHPPLTLC